MSFQRRRTILQSRNELRLTHQELRLQDFQAVGEALALPAEPVFVLAGKRLRLDGREQAVLVISPANRVSTAKDQRSRTNGHGPTVKNQRNAQTLGIKGTSVREKNQTAARASASAQAVNQKAGSSEVADGRQPHQLNHGAGQPGYKQCGCQMPPTRNAYCAENNGHIHDSRPTTILQTPEGKSYVHRIIQRLSNVRPSSWLPSSHERYQASTTTVYAHYIQTTEKKMMQEEKELLP